MVSSCLEAYTYSRTLISFENTISSFKRDKPWISINHRTCDVSLFKVPLLCVYFCERDRPSIYINHRTCDVSLLGAPLLCFSRIPVLLPCFWVFLWARPATMTCLGDTLTVCTSDRWHIPELNHQMMATSVQKILEVTEANSIPLFFHFVFYSISVMTYIHIMYMLPKQKIGIMSGHTLLLPPTLIPFWGCMLLAD